MKRFTVLIITFATALALLGASPASAHASDESYLFLDVASSDLGGTVQIPYDDLTEVAKRGYERRMAEGTKIVEEGGERLEYLQRMNDAIDSAGPNEGLSETATGTASIPTASSPSGRRTG